VTAPERTAAAPATPPDRTSAAPAAPVVRTPRELLLLVLTALLASVALLWAGDRLARDAAESLVSRELQRLTGTEAAPEVELHGSVFLLQALTGDYERVDVTLRGLSSGPLRVERIEAELSGVRLPFSELVRRNPSVLGVESASATALLSYADLDRYLDFTGRPYTVTPGGGDSELEIRGELRVLGNGYSVTADTVLGAEGGALTVSPERVRTGSTPGRPAELLLRQRLTFLVPLDLLPFGQQVTDVTATPGGVVVRTASDALVLRPR
jgi:LmeA-like phospholipid-binding